MNRYQWISLHCFEFYAIDYFPQCRERQWVTVINSWKRFSIVASVSILNSHYRRTLTFILFGKQQNREEWNRKQDKSIKQMQGIRRQTRKPCNFKRPKFKRAQGSNSEEEPQMLITHPGSRQAFAEAGNMARLRATAPSALCLSTTV